MVMFSIMQFPSFNYVEEGIGYVEFSIQISYVLGDTINFSLLIKQIVQPSC